MIRTLLIANRGEIACRVIATAKRLGIRTIAVFSDADRQAQHVLAADEAVYIGAAPSSESYLVVERIIAAAKQTGADAIHPGYGFLSENEVFAEACAEHNIIFVGPPTSAIAAMGSKSAAKAIMSEAEVPLVPGYHGDEQSSAKLAAEAEKIGYPVLLKAAYGGGGKGMRAVHDAAEFNEALAAAKREAKASFNNDKMLVEKFIQQPRHVEIQVFADQHGNGVYLAERDCSVQRRHQKVIEEAPAPGLTEATRKAMGEAAIRAAQAIDYVGAGTVEFLLDKDQRFYFMEMNTRLQVEHPVTEMITGQDLVEWQLRVASGEPLPLNQAQITTTGHAFEARIYAEDPDHNFLPCTGVLKHLRPPVTGADVRVDTGVIEGDEVSAYYDPMIAKLIVWADDRTTALRKLEQCLNEYRIAGLVTNIDFLKRIARHHDFQAAKLSTQFIEEHEASLFADHAQAEFYAGLAGLAVIAQQQAQTTANPWSQASAFRLNAAASFAVPLTINGELAEQRFVAQGNTWQQGEQRWQIRSYDSSEGLLRYAYNDSYQQVHVYVDADGVTLFHPEHTQTFGLHQVADSLIETAPAGSLTAPMNGTVVELLVSKGDSVSEGQAVVIMEAMKMEYTIRAPQAGTVTATYYAKGDLVSDGAELVQIEPTEEA